MRVFISHSVKDESIVMQLKDGLSEKGIDPYVASERKQPGRRLSSKIKEAIRSSDAVVAVLTDRGVKSPWVNQEMGYAEGRVTIIPLVEHGVSPPAFLQGIEYLRLNVSMLERTVEDVVSCLGIAKGTAVSRKRAARNRVEHLINDVLEVPVGGYSQIALDVARGDKVTGYLREEDGYDFDWYILDEKNLVKFSEDEEFHASRLDEGVSTSRINWKVPKGGPWYLVLEIYRKSIVRTVEVVLRREPKAE